MKQKNLITSPFNRAMKLGGLVGRVSTSMLGAKTMGFFSAEPVQKIRQAENLIRNAHRIVETLGSLKGAAMKVGQMLSLHEGFLPPEMAHVLSMLQKEAPSVPFEVIEAQIRNNLQEKYELFASIEPEAYASASIGQVHRAQLKDGRQVVIKVQYPGIDQVVGADLKNLKNILGTLFSMVSDIPLDPVWGEVTARLMEELDYHQEAQHMKKMGHFYADIPEIIVPQVLEELSSKQVLTMEFIQGISPQEACSDQYSQSLRDLWGKTLWEFILSGIFRFRYLHVDPNFANFAFQEGGNVIVYDYGCMKEIPVAIAEAMAKLIQAILKDEKHTIPELLKSMGVNKLGGDLLPAEMTDPYVELIQEIYREAPPYTFGQDQNLYIKIFELGKMFWKEAMDLDFPKDIIFIDRTFAGHIGNLSKMKVTANWRELVTRYIQFALNG
ncbi:AarF/ABC1/UbiB kinase family protein [Deltaproteobacteria bacterium TL4]